MSEHVPVGRAQTFLAEASRLFASSLDEGRILDTLVHLAVPVLGDWCVVDLLDEAGALRRVAVASADPAKEGLTRELLVGYPADVDPGAGAAAVARSGKAIRFPDVSDELLRQTARDARESEILRALGIRSCVTVPLVARDRILGVLSCVSASPQRRYDDEQLALAEDLAHRVALALDNARLYRAEQQARSAAEQEKARFAFMARASAALASSLDYEATLQRVADLAIPDLADWCSLYLRVDDGLVRQVAVAARDPEKVLLLRRLGTEYLPRAGSGSLLLRAIRTAAPQIVPRYREEHLQRNAQDAEHLRILRRLDVTSRVAVPLNLRDRVIGGLVLAHAESRRVYGADDVTLAEELARRCAVAIENATLYAAERRARAQVEQMYAEAQEAVRLRDEFLSVAAHELKTPLTGILGSTQLVLRTIATGRAISLDQIQRRVGVVEQQARRLARLVNQLLEVSQLEAGQLRLRREILDLVAIVEGVAETTRTHAPNHEIEVRATGSVRVAVDPLRLEQVIANLLDNAVKYSPDGGPVVVEVEALPSGAARIRVTDRGIGIPPEQRAHMFDRFYQAHVGVHLSGLGLGLYLSRQIVELHGGTLDVAFPDEGGTTFVVQLPL